jgi:glucose/arabinose dehydrogenase
MAWELEEPVYLTAVPGSDDIYLVERAGRVWRVPGGEVAESAVLDISQRVGSGIEQGFLSIALHPEFARNGLLYGFYSDLDGDVVISELEVVEGAIDPAAERVLLDLDKPEGVQWHNGGQLQFGPDGLLYSSHGDAARNPLDPLPDPHPTRADPDNHAQNESLPWGKLLKIDVHGTPGEYELAALGLRNPWRFSFDSETGDLFIGDVGQFAWEEVDLVPAGTAELPNFGWSICEGVVRYKDGEITGPGEQIGPIAVYGHRVPDYCHGRGTVVGGYVYRGEAIPDLLGQYVFGDYCTSEIWALTIEDGAVTAAAVLVSEMRNLVSFGVDGQGELYAISATDGIFRLVPTAT